MNSNTGNYSAKHWSLKAVQAKDKAKETEIKVFEYKTQIEELINDFKKILNTYVRAITSDTTEWVVIEPIIKKSTFKNVKQIKKFWIPTTCEIIEAENYLESPFYGCSPDCIIFTNVIDSNSIPVGWGQFWNYYSQTGKLTVNYNSTMQNFNEFNVDE